MLEEKVLNDVQFHSSLFNFLATASFNDYDDSVLVQTKNRRPKASVKGILKHPDERRSLAQRSIEIH